MPMIWKFVDRPESGATVLLDMNDGMTWKTLGDEFFKLPSPQLRRSVVSNNLTDGGLVTSSNYDLRELVFTLQLTAPSEAGRIAQLDALKRALAVPGLIMYKPADGQYPVFFRTLRSDEYELNNQFIPGVAWRVACNVLAQPFAIGERHDIVSGAVVTNNPAAVTNPTILDITGVRGDSPSPALARVGNGFGGGSTFVLASRTANNPTALTTFAQAEAGSVGTDTTVQANDAAMSGAGSNFVRCTFATNTLITRLTVSVPTATSGEALRGRYRVYVRLRRSSNTSAFLLRYRVAGVTGLSVNWTTSMANLWHLDLGLVDLPAYGPGTAAIGYSGLAPALTSLSLEIQAQRSSGALNLDIDYVYLVPADEASFSLQQVGTPNSFVLDGPNDKVYGLASGSSPFDPAVANRVIDFGGGLIPTFGGLPALVPGVTNRWYILRTNQTVTAQSTWDVSYWPYWREVATS